jgi:signal transduction histidine kinase
MTSLRARLTAIFLVGIMLVSLVVLGAVYVGLHEELLDGAHERTHPDSPDHLMSHTLTAEDVAHVQSEMIRLVLIAGLPALVLAMTTGWWLAGRSLQPIRQLNKELLHIDPQTLSKRVSLRSSGSEEAELRRQINDLLARLEKGFEQLRTFSTHVAHELRSPLQVIRLQVEQAAPTLEPELAESLQHELTRLTAYVDQALALARAEQGREPVSPTDFDLGELVRSLATDYSAILGTQNRSLEIRGRATSVHADRAHAQRILHNLLSNAVRHGTGCVRVRLAGPNVTVANRIGAVGASAGLGIGLLLSEALARLQPEARLATRRRQGWFLARLRFGD